MRTIALTVGMEAALFFSAPTWLLSGERAWPANNPMLFVFAVSTIAAFSAIFYHVLPVLYGDQIAQLKKVNSNRISVLRLGLAGWFCTGAMISAYQLSQIASSTAFSGFGVSGKWTMIAFSVLTAVILCLIASLGNNHIQVFCISIGLVGLIAVVAASYLQAAGLHSLNGYLQDETNLNDLGSVCRGTCISAAPVIFIALQIARQKLSRTMAWITGALGVWLPLSFSAVLIAWAKVSGARLYWRPSVPIGIQFAFISLFHTIGIQAGRSYLALSLSVPLVFCIVAVKSSMNYLPNDKAVRIGVVAASVVSTLIILPFSSRSALYFQPWCWSILLCGVACGGLSVVAITRRLTVQFGDRRDSAKHHGSS